MLPAGRPSLLTNQWVIALTVTMATFMEVLDTSIANVSLPHIAGNLSVSTNESTWVLTSYLVANAIVLPLSGWLSSILGRKRFYMMCVLMFTISSMLCGHGDEPGAIDFLPRAAGNRGRRLAAIGAGDSGRHISAAEARHGDGRLWDGDPRGPGARADARRLDHRQLFLALDFLHQRAGRMRCRCCSAASCSAIRRI